SIGLAPLVYLEAKSKIWRSGRWNGVSCLLVAVDNAAAVEVVRTELNRDAVAGEDADEVFAHTSGDVSKGLVLVFKLDLEHRIWQRFDDHGHHFNCIFLRQTVSFGKVGGWPLCFRNFLFFGWSLRLHPDMPLRALAHAASLIVPQNGAVFPFSVK